MTTRLIRAALILALTGCASAQRVWLSDPVALDRELFPHVVAAILRDSVGAPHRFDPRPADSNPMISLDLIGPSTGDAVFADSIAADIAIMRQRAAILEKRGMQLTDHRKDDRCPGGLRPRDAEFVALLRERCPVDAYRSTSVGTAQRKALEWPSRTDVLKEYPDRDVVSVSVDVSSVGPDGAVHVSYDYFFERTKGRAWLFLKRDGLIIAE